MAKQTPEDPAMSKARIAFEKSGMTQQELGERMGYPSASARQSVSQWLHSNDPRISTLRRFAKAIGVQLESLL